MVKLATSLFDGSEMPIGEVDEVLDDLARSLVLSVEQTRALRAARRYLRHLEGRLRGRDNLFSR